MARSAKQTKFIFVTGGVLSGVGKGITAASIGSLLKARGLSVNIQKCDPYLNMDAGTLNPAEHGECFVTHDGAETDLDVGHYERFLDTELTAASSLMSGRILSEVIGGERSGRYLGQTVQFIPHVTDHIQRTIAATGKSFDVHIIEIGGTVGDYESLSFIEAIREMGVNLGPDNCLFVHVVYMPYLGASGEFKTKPAQNAVRELRSLGIVPDALIARSELKPPKSVLPKLSMFTGVEREAIALLPNAKTIYEVPLSLEAAGIGDVVSRRLGLRSQKPDLASWQRVVKSASTRYRSTIKVGIIAKYIDNQDTYMSVFEALRSAAWAADVNIDIVWVNAESLEKDKNLRSALTALDGILVPGGFGRRGLEGKIFAAQYSLTNKVPYLGLCLGLQMAVIAAARNTGLKGATSVELNEKGASRVIDYMADQKDKAFTGGSMRLGNYPAKLEQGSLARRVYGQENIIERHRHRCECANAYRPKYAKWGIKASGLSPDGHLVEMIEATDHPYFLATQAHPEFRSRPNRPHPMFLGFIKAVIANS
ncbi:CTP synthase [Candidatus Saccharibacteria bacterium RIFCSPHIGHO2_12_FULL_49_19]|nr:MAG: CTP synthase [Candidatus Saccharibacteria bacterium RIFCSPHIGHO2_01_FULL_49_21]OGL36857.1 MAG: CTP synthase [Candidatus Saccharibacteria bacterium RIFCSPHIGHO2_12_FULL_49_19]OGL37088.1 MAG: CTP synthase [Candidatus Saccharibacteria bacterium RIFCSPLOWO2_01_FULL_49_22]